MSLVKKLLCCFMLATITLFLLELTFGLYYFFRRDVVGFPIKQLRNIRIKTSRSPINIYTTPWDAGKDHMIPGKYVIGRGIHFKVNKFGFRGDDFNPHDRSKYRIICLGGSSTVGMESPEGQTYPDLLEEKLNDIGISSEVLNFGMNGRSLKYIYKILLSDVEKANPNAILIYSNRNTALYDANAVGFMGTDFKNKYEVRLMQLHHLFFDNYLTYKFIYNQYTKILPKIKGTEIAYAKIFNGKPLNIDEDYLRNGYVRVLMSIIQYAKQKGWKIILVKQPIYLNKKVQLKIMSYSINKLIEEIKSGHNLTSYVSKFESSNVEAKYWILSNALLNRHLDSLKDNTNVFVVDPVLSFLEHDNIDDLFVDYVHLTPKGNDLLASKIFETLRKPIQTSYLIWEKNKAQ